MAGSKSLKGIIDGFLGTYVSRYSAYDGYWLFGFLVPELTTMRLDLLNPSSDRRPHFQRAIDVATAKFREQASKGKVDLTSVIRAELTMARAETPAVFAVNGVPMKWSLRVSVVVEVRGGRRYEAERVIVVAPHDSSVERRSRQNRLPSEPDESR